MGIAMRITRFRLIIICLVATFLVAALCIGRLLLCPSATMTSRNSIKARLLLPKDIRDFPIERYADPNDRFVYSISSHESHWQISLLRITTSPDRLGSYKQAFRTFLSPRGRLSEGKRTLLLRPAGSKDSTAVVRFDSAGAGAGLRITFEYRSLGIGQRLLASKFGRLLAPVFRRFWPVDATTQMS
ncbi:MAG: hypothetical protein JSU94_01285 [Phycisphaerales bacterium]|nr:MAG: hypothetical protein JSU94_01285 [Phycisphaerales bacterium]